MPNGWAGRVVLLEIAEWLSIGRTMGARNLCGVNPGRLVDDYGFDVHHTDLSFVRSGLVTCSACMPRTAAHGMNVAHGSRENDNVARMPVSSTTRSGVGTTGSSSYISTSGFART